MSRICYKDRETAGREIAGMMNDIHLGMPLVLAIPRGGVVVGYELATALRAELDIIVPRKIGAPGEPELAIGAVMHDGSLFLNEKFVRWVDGKPEYVEEERKRQTEEALRRFRSYRGDRPYPELSGRDIVVVDDGIATGATIIVALRWLRARGVGKIAVASPVAPGETIRRLKLEADLVICPKVPEDFNAIGQFYEDFDQVTDEEVIALLNRAWRGGQR